MTVSIEANAAPKPEIGKLRRALTRGGAAISLVAVGCSGFYLTATTQAPTHTPAISITLRPAAK